MFDREGLIERLTEELYQRLKAEEAGELPRPTGAPLSDLIEAGADRLGLCSGEDCSPECLGSLIDHTLLKPGATMRDIDQLCGEAAEHRFKSVCVNPGWVERCARKLSGTGVAVCTVIGFPLGATTTETKAFEARQAQDNGARELDMVIHVGRLKGGDHDYVHKDIQAVCGARRSGTLVKVIIETCLLTDEEKKVACELARQAGADFVKTSTGFAGGGATVADVALMRQAVGHSLGVKASGGVKSRDDLMAMVKAGATRIGASAGIRIVTEKDG